MGAKSSYNAMLKIVKQAKGGTVFIPDDFTACGTPDAVRSGLTRMCRNGVVYRFAKGIYYTPSYDRWDGTFRKPSLDTVLLKIIRRDNVRIIPTGAYALNKLGLTTQIPANLVYITDGSSRQIKFEDGRIITFRHSNELRNFAYQSILMQLAVLAMRELGEKNITEEQISKIKDMISRHVPPQDYNHDIVFAPTWIKKLLQR